MNSKLLRIIKEENKRPKLIAHDICAHNTGRRLDLEICETLQNVGEIRYQSPIFSQSSEFAMSVWPWHYEFCNMWCHREHKRKGVIFFSDNFYDKITSPGLSDKELTSIFKIILQSGGYYYILGTSLVREIMKDFGLKRMTREEGFRSLSEHIYSINGVPLDTYRKKDHHLIYHLGRAMQSIMGLRCGDPTKGKGGGIWFDCARIIANNVDEGVRAVRLIAERNLESLSYERKDVRYLFSVKDNDLSTAKMLIGPEK